MALLAPPRPLSDVHLGLIFPCRGHHHGQCRRPPRRRPSASLLRSSVGSSRGWQLPDQRPDAGWWSRLFAFQNLVVATDFKRENRFDIQEPERTWGVNVVLGLIYGESFGVTGERTIRYEVSYYNGVNPHGQFRQDKLSYLGLNFVIDF